MTPEGHAGWDEYAPFYDWENARTLGRRDLPFWRTVALQVGGPVLELGCGTGLYTEQMAPFCGELVATDISEALLREDDPDAAFAQVCTRLDAAQGALETARTALATMQSRKAELQAERDDAATLSAEARAELTGIEREHAALARDREARAKRSTASHGLPAAIDTVRDGRWPEAPKAAERFVFRDLADCRVGLAGYGTINRHYRRFVRGFGCEVSTYDPFVDEATLAADDVRPTASLVDLAAGSDVFMVAIPPTPSTLGVIDADVIDALPVGSLFVLVSRMAVVEQEALWRRVRAEEIRAAIDVYDPEPPPADAWFRRHPNVLPTPHIAGNVQFAHERCFREACVDAVRVLRGEEPLHAASPRDQRLYDGSLRDDES